MYIYYFFLSKIMFFFLENIQNPDRKQKSLYYIKRIALVILGMKGLERWLKSSTSKMGLLAWSRNDWNEGGPCSGGCLLFVILSARTHLAFKYFRSQCLSLPECPGKQKSRGLGTVLQLGRKGTLMDVRTNMQMARANLSPCHPSDNNPEIQYPFSISLISQ